LNDQIPKQKKNKSETKPPKEMSKKYFKNNYGQRIVLLEYCVADSLSSAPAVPEF